VETVKLGYDNIKETIVNWSC